MMVGSRYHVASQIDAAQSLWRCVVIQALRDACVVRANPTPEDERNKRAAEAWLDAAGPDFCHVCDLAGFSPEGVQRWWRAARRNAAEMARANTRLREAKGG